MIGEVTKRFLYFFQPFEAPLSRSRSEDISEKVEAVSQPLAQNPKLVKLLCFSERAGGGKKSPAEVSQSFAGKFTVAFLAAESDCCEKLLLSDRPLPGQEFSLTVTNRSSTADLLVAEQADQTFWRAVDQRIFAGGRPLLPKSVNQYIEIACFASCPPDPSQPPLETPAIPGRYERCEGG